MKKIGFIDYYISEWHADNYPAWFKEVNEALGYDYEITYAWAEEYVSPVDGKNTDEWCKEMGITRLATIEEICEKSDYLLILAPSNPEKHLQYAKLVFPYGKPTYIDKPFSDSVENANAIFALAEQYGVKFFSSSALRYAEELNTVDTCVAMTTTGGYGSVEEYIIHQAEMIVKKVGLGANAIKAQRITDNEYTFTVLFPDERRAGMHFVKGNAPFSAIMSKGDGSDAVYTLAETNTFKGLLKDILTFFETGNRSFDSAETLEVNNLVVAAIKAKNSLDEWIAI